VGLTASKAGTISSARRISGPAGRGLNLAHFLHGAAVTNVNDNCHAVETGDNLTEEFEPLAGKIGRLVR
jgi:hypothetical protein